MRYLIIIMALLSACSNKSLNKESSVIAQVEEQGLVLIESYQRFSSGGKERDDGTHASTNFSIVINKAEEVNIDAVLIYGIEHPYEAFEYEGLFYIISKVYSEENAASMDRQNDIPGEVIYNYKGEGRSLIIENFEVKDPLKGN